MTLTRARTIQYVGILCSLLLIAAGYWYFSVRAGVKSNTSASQPQGTGQLDSGLAGYWAFDNGSGTTATDASTNGNNGTLTNGPTWTTGQIGSAVSLDGVDDYISTGTTLTSTDSITLSVWVKGDTSAGNDFPIFGNINGQEGSDHQCLFYDNGGTENLFFGNGNGGSVSVQVSGTGATLSTNWHHVAYTNNGTKNSLYLDGIRLVETTSNALTSAAEQNLHIGRCQTGGGTFYFDGLIDEARVYRRALSTDEIGQLYRLTSPTSVDTGLKGYWSFDGQDMSGTTAYDRSGAGNNGTLTNGPTKTMSVVGQGLNFDGTNDYVDIPYAGLDFERTDPLSFSMWVKPADFAPAGGAQTFLGRIGVSGSRGTFVGWCKNAIVNVCNAQSLVFNIFNNAHVNGLMVSTATSSVLPGVWMHVVVTYDGSSTPGGVKIYKDGVSMPLTTKANTLSATVKAGINWRIGDDATNDWHNGGIDEVRVYNRALSASEIKSLYDVSQSDKTNSSSSQAQGTGRLDSGLAGYWTLDENTGTSAGDASTNGNTGTLTNGPTWTTGQIGSAVDFDGANDYVEIGSSLKVSNADRGAVTAWVKFDSWTDINAFVKSFFSYGSQAASGAGTISFEQQYFTSAHYLTITQNLDNSGGYDVIRGSTPLSLSTWYHVAVVSDGSAYRLYLNGIEEGITIASGANTGDWFSDTTLNETNDHTVIGGRWQNGAIGSLVDGQIDEVRVYNRPLSSDEVSQLYRLTTPTAVETSLKGYWSFSGKDLSGTTAYDRSGAGNNGTLTNGPTSTNSILGQGLLFDGTNDNVTVADASAFTGSALTVSFWKKDTNVLSNRSLVAKSSSAQRSWSVEGDDVSTGNGDSAVRFYTATGLSEVSTYGTTPSVMAAGQWYHVVAVFNGSGSGNSGRMQVYINGVAQSLTFSGTIPASLQDNTAALLIAEGGLSSTRFLGSMDEVRVYNRALTASEIRGQYDTVVPDKTNSSITQPQGTGRLDSGLSGYWRLDDGTSGATPTSATDSSTNGNTGTLTNSPTWTAGRIGNGVDFDGTDDHITTGKKWSSFVSASTGTLSAWIMPQGSPNTRSNSFYTEGVIADNNGAVGAFAGILRGAATSQGSTDRIWIYNYDGSEDVVGIPYVNDEWIHVTWVHSGNVLYAYKNGTLYGTTPSGNTTNITATNVDLGGGGIANDKFDGLIDEVRTYSRALSADEISQLYRLTTPTGTETGLKGYWSFNGKDLSGTIAYDRSGAGNTGTLTGGPTVINGKLGQGLSFDGSNDYVNITSMSSAMFANTTFTATGWFKTSTASGQGVLSQDHCDGGWFIRADSGTLNVSLRANGGCGGGGASRSSSATNLANGMWHHFATVITTDTVTAGNNNIVIYIDGVLNQGSLTAGLVYGTAGDSQVQIGTRYSGDQPFLGLMDEVRIYNRGLTAAEVLSLYNQSK